MIRKIKENLDKKIKNNQMEQLNKKVLWIL